MTEGKTGRDGERSQVWKEIHRSIADLSLDGGEYTEEELKDLWYRRAIELGRVPLHEQERGDRMKLVTFRLGSDHYGVSISMVREIQRAGRITPVPTAPPFVVGVMNLRGSVLSVIDVRVFFGLPAAERGDRTRILVVENDSLRVGMIVERVDEITDVRTEEIKPPLSLDKGITEDYIRGIVTHRGEMLIVIELEKILSNPRLVVEESV